MLPQNVADSGRLDITFAALHHAMLEHFFRHATNIVPSDNNTGLQISAASLQTADAVAESKVLSKLEYIGFQVGMRYVEKISRDRPRMREEVDVMRFLCRDMWQQLFEKQADTLKTDTKTYKIFEIFDRDFRPLRAVLTAESSQYLELCPRLLAFPTGLIRGVLDGLGYQSMISARTCNMSEIDANAQYKGWVTVFEVRLPQPS